LQELRRELSAALERGKEKEAEVSKLRASVASTAKRFKDAKEEAERLGRENKSLQERLALSHPAERESPSFSGRGDDLVRPPYPCTVAIATQGSE
jgi:chromosome segregation ATPase